MAIQRTMIEMPNLPQTQEHESTTYKQKRWIPKALDEIDPIMPNSSTRMSAVTEEYLDSQLDKLATAYSGKKGGDKCDRGEGLAF